MESSHCLRNVGYKEVSDEYFETKSIGIIEYDPLHIGPGLQYGFLRFGQ